MTAVVIEGVEKRYGDVVAVGGVDLRIEAGETFVLVGESGCGKTTLLRMINRLVVPDRGSIHVMGKNIADVDAPALRREIGYVIQDVGLFAHFSVARNVAVVPRLLGWSSQRIAARVEELLELVGLPARDFGQRFPRELSGGQRQRVGIARALAADPPLVLLDEPFGALDPITREYMQDEFVALSQRLKKTFVLVTHDVFEAVRLGDRIGVMRDGQLLRCAAPHALVRDPGDPFVEALLGRHRFQLRLMTLRLADLDAAEVSEPNDAWPLLGERASVWDALARCDELGVDGVRVGRGNDRHSLAREALVTAASDTGPPSDDRRSRPRS